MSSAMEVDEGSIRLPYRHDEETSGAEMCREIWMRVQDEVLTAQRLGSRSDPLLLKSLVPPIMAKSTFHLPAVEKSLRGFLPLDEAVNVMLAPLVNWAPPSYKPTDQYVQGLRSRLWAIPTNADGDCLLHAASLCLWGQQDRTSVLRSLLTEIFSDSPSVRQLYHHWREEQRREDQRREDAGVPLEMEEGQLINEWHKLVRDAQKPSAYLSSVHIFALANALRRPIIIYGDCFIRDKNDKPFSPSDMRGIYLPTLLPSMLCSKTPITVGYTCTIAGKVGHFTALVGIDGELEHLPLCDEHGMDLPVRYGSSSMVEQHIMTTQYRTEEGMQYRLAKLPESEMIPGAQGVQRSIKLAAWHKFEQYLLSRGQVPTPKHVLRDHLLNPTDRSNSATEDSAAAGNGGQGNVEDDSCKRKPQDSPTVSPFETNPPQNATDTAIPAVEKRWRSGQVERGCRGTGWVCRRPTSKDRLRGSGDLPSVPFSFSSKQRGPDTSMVSSSAVSEATTNVRRATVGGGPPRPDNVAVGLSYQSSPLSTSMSSKSSAGCSGEDESRRRSGDEASVSGKSIAGLSASLPRWITTRRVLAAQTTTTQTRTNPLREVTSSPSSSPSRDSAGFDSHRCNGASPSPCPCNSRPVPNSATRRIEFLGSLFRRLGWGWGWGWGKSGACFSHSHGEAIEGGGAGGSCSTGEGTGIANDAAIPHGVMSALGSATASYKSKARGTTWGENVESSSGSHMRTSTPPSPPPPSPARPSEAMAMRTTSFESPASLVAPPSSPVEAAIASTVAGSSEPSTHVSRLSSRALKKRKTGGGSGIATRAGLIDSSAIETLSSIRRKKSITADSSAPEAAKAASEGQCPRAYHHSRFC